MIIWGLWSAGGPSTLIIVFTALITATFVLAYKTSTARPVVTATLVVLCAATARIATAPRPQMFNLLLMALLIWLLEQVRSGRFAPRAAWASVPLVLVWANLHSGYLLGVVVLAVYAVGEQLERRRSSDDPCRWQPLGACR